MIRRAATHYMQLAALQNINALARRRELENSCAETDRCSDDEAALAQEFLEAKARLFAVHAEERLCLDRLRLAVAIMGDREEALLGGRAALAQSQSAEEQTRLVWMTARHRVEWLTDQARELHKREAARQDEAAEIESRSLRLALGPRGAS